jgi:hypothetical protein
MPIVKLPNGSLRDEIREPLYDTIDLVGAGVAVTEDDRTFFLDIQGKQKPIETNLRQPQQLDTANSFRVMGLALDVQNYQATNVTALASIMDHSGLTLNVGEKRYWEGPMRFAAGRLWTDIAGIVDGCHQQHGFSAVAGVILTGKHVVDINPLQSFNVVWALRNLGAQAADTTLAAGTKLRYVCSLKGLRRRPVQ